MLATMARDPDPVSPDLIAKAKDPGPDTTENRPDLVPVHCRSRNCTMVLLTEPDFRLQPSQTSGPKPQHYPHTVCFSSCI